METNNDGMLALLQKACADNDSKIFVIKPEQEKEIKQIIRSRRKTQLEKLFRNKACILVFCGIVLFYLLAHWSLYTSAIKYLLPFVGLVVLFAASIAGHAYELHLILGMGSANATSKKVALNMAKLRIFEKKEFVASLCIALPVLIACLPPITSLTFNRSDFYQNLTAYLPAIIAGIVVSLIAGCIYYRKKTHTINEFANIEKVINEEY